MDISVVICTRNRADRLPEMLASLQNLKSAGIAWELILVDNNSSDATLSILKEFSLNFSAPTTVIHEPKDGLSNARNTGWRAAHGRIVSFTDDDCYPQEDWLLTTINAFEESNASYIGGRVLLFDANDAPITIQTSMQPILFSAHAHVESGQIIGANFSFRREIFDVIGGFDDRLGAGTPFHSGEDTDLLIRASLSGFEGRYDPSIVVFHHHRRKLGKDVEKLYRGYAYGRGALSVKTITESRAKMPHIKGWYWRIRSLMNKGKYSYVINELKGAVHFIFHMKQRSSPVNYAILLEGKPVRSKTGDLRLQAPALTRNMKVLFEDPLLNERSFAEIDKDRSF